MNIKKQLCMLLCLLLLPSCYMQNSKEVSKTVYAMDTVMELKAYGTNAAEAIDKAEQEILRLDTLLDRKNTESEIYKINMQKSAKVSSDTIDVINRALSVSQMTNGIFDISIAPVMDLWGFYTKEYHVPNSDELLYALSKVDYKNISLNGNSVSLNGETQIDLGGIAKGFLSERIINIFKEAGVTSGIISLGGNVQALNRKPDNSYWKVAIQNPDNSSYIGTLSVEDSAVITSGGYQRYFEENGVVYHHIIDPKTGTPAKSGIKSVSVVSKDAVLADSLSTALFIMGLDNGIEYWRSLEGFDAIFMTEDNKIYITSGLKNIFKSEYDFEVIN